MSWPEKRVLFAVAVSEKIGPEESHGVGIG